MTDFLDRLGVELIAAEQRLVAEAVAAPMPMAPVVRAPRFRRRGTLLVFAVLLVSVPTVAATRPWEPLLGNPRHEDTPAGVSPTPPPPAQLRELGVLRRPQSTSDQHAARRLFAAVGAEYKGVRVAGIRLLRAAGGQEALLVPTEAHGRTPAGGFETADRLCVQTADFSFCGDADALAAGDIVGGFGSNFLGLVPDGVARVRVTVPTHQSVSTDVRENFFWITGVTLAGPVQPRIEWLDASGRRVGPPR